MLSLPLELKIVIASLQQETWICMWRYDPNFRGYSNSEIGKTLFTKLFGVVETDEATTRWYLFGKLNRENDLPVIIWVDGTKYWYKNGLLHRENDLPAVVYSNGAQRWYKKGVLHRENDLPAVICSDGTKHWYRNGFLHRENGHPAIIHADGFKCWYLNGVLKFDSNSAKSVKRIFPVLRRGLRR